jgi:hypothetical protein
MTLLGITLEQTTRKEAQRLLGRAGCYAGSDGTTLVLVWNREMGERTVITEYHLMASAQAVADYSGVKYVVPPSNHPRCAMLRSLSRSTATAGGLRLGMSAEDLRRLLGEPEEASADRLVFTSEASIPVTPKLKEALAIPGDARFFGDVWVRRRLMTVELVGGKAITIRVYQITST